MKNEMNYFYDTTPVLDMEHFIDLLLASLASKTKTKVASLPQNYKESIEKIMYAKNGWGIKFSELIDANKYYEDQYEWEKDFSIGIIEYLKKQQKEAQYDFNVDSINIKYTTNEIEETFNKYDNNVIETMNHFSNLIEAFSNNRRCDLIKKDVERDMNKEYIKTGSFTWSK